MNYQIFYAMGRNDAKRKKTWEKYKMRGKLKKLKQHCSMISLPFQPNKEVVTDPCKIQQTKECLNSVKSSNVFCHEMSDFIEGNGKLSSKPIEANSCSHKIAGETIPDVCSENSPRNIDTNELWEGIQHDFSENVQSQQETIRNEKQQHSEAVICHEKSHHFQSVDLFADNSPSAIGSTDLHGSSISDNVKKYNVDKSSLFSLKFLKGSKKVRFSLPECCDPGQNSADSCKVVEMEKTIAKSFASSTTATQMPITTAAQSSCLTTTAAQCFSPLTTTAAHSPLTTTSAQISSLTTTAAHSPLTTTAAHSPLTTAPAQSSSLTTTAAQSSSLTVSSLASSDFSLTVKKVQFSPHVTRVKYLKESTKPPKIVLFNGETKVQLLNKRKFRKHSLCVNNAKPTALELKMMNSICTNFDEANARISIRKFKAFYKYCKSNGRKDVWNHFLCSDEGKISYALILSDLKKKLEGNKIKKTDKNLSTSKPNNNKLVDIKSTDNVCYSKFEDFKSTNEVDRDENVHMGSDIQNNYNKLKDVELNSGTFSPLQTSNGIPQTNDSWKKDLLVNCSFFKNMEKVSLLENSLDFFL